METTKAIQQKTSISPAAYINRDTNAGQKLRLKQNEQLARLIRPASLGIQPKLTIGAVNDPLEQQADAMTDRLMRMPDPQVTNPVSFLSAGSGLQRKCADCEQKEKQLQRKETNDSVPSVGADFERYVGGLSGGGQPLSDEVRSFYEPRFGYDFSQVKVHTDGVAAKSAQSINALAFTSGNNIVFNSGQYAPTTDSGKRLLGHELTHVVQQKNNLNRVVQRKEINRSWRQYFVRKLPQDWYKADRMAWQQASIEGVNSKLPQANTFISAAIYNTTNLRPNEYSNIEERHDYYDIISYVLDNDPNTPAPLKGIRFFHATTFVTGTPGVGTADKLGGAVMLLQQSKILLREVNAELFAMNMGIIRNLLLNWREPRNPTNPQGGVSAFDFDIMMVETEQNRVEQSIKNNQARYTPAVITDINNTLDPSWLGKLNPGHVTFEWAMQALGVNKLDFTVRAHRIAIGRATVHMFHKRSLQDYIAYMQQHPIDIQTVTPASGVSGNAVSTP